MRIISAGTKPPLSEPLQGGYLSQLDGLRGVAVVFVVLYHWIPEFHDIAGVNLGSLGVSIFFSLSGFLICGILLRARETIKERGKQTVVRNFFFRRALRLIPLYYIVIATAWICNTGEFRTIWPWHAAYLSNVHFHLHGFHGVGLHLWTLSVEEQFYLVFPWVVLFLPLRTLGWVLGLAVLSAPAWRLFANGGRPDLLLPASLDVLCAGALVAFWSRHGGRRSIPWGIVAAVSALLWLAVGNTSWGWALRPFFLSGVLAWLVGAVATSRGRWAKGLAWGPLAAVGKVSYGIYLIHNFVPMIWAWIMFSAPIPGYRVLARLGIPESWFTQAWSSRLQWLILIWVIVGASWKYIESPALRLKSRFY